MKGWECGDPYSGIGCPVPGCTHDPKGWPESATMTAPEPREDVAVAAALASALSEADDTVDARYCRHVAEVQAAALAPLIAERVRAAAVEALRDAADDLEALVDAQHPDALNPDQWLRDRADRRAER